MAKIPDNEKRCGHEVALTIPQGQNDLLTYYTDVGEVHYADTLEVKCDRSVHEDRWHFLGLELTDARNGQRVSASLVWCAVPSPEGES